ncbi:DEAD/DEAH box helicase, partial [Bacteroides thetaiotaomicron]
MAFKTTKSESTSFSTPQEMFQDNKMKSIMGLIDHQSKTLDNYMETIQSNGNIVNKYVAFELPTGCGKTLIGILIAEFNRRKFHRKALFLCPTKQLVTQVCNQAKRQYGIEAVAFCGKQSEYSAVDKSAYILGQKIGVTTYSSFFATSQYFSDPDILIFDDVHSAENYIADGWSLDIQRQDYELLYLQLAECFKEIIGDSEYSRMVATDPYT